VRLPRWLHRWYANHYGYFWLPCPLCGEPFGGHEWGVWADLYCGDGSCQGVCRHCTQYSEEINAEVWGEHWAAPETG